MHGGNDWLAIAALVPGRTAVQCSSRWKDGLTFSIDPMTLHAHKWTADDDKKLKDAIPTQGEKNWEAITALFPGRTKRQCRSRWQDTLICNIDPTTVRKGKWTADEDTKLKSAMQAHGDKNWDAITALVLGRTKVQCRNRWRAFLDPDIGAVIVCTDEWTLDEDSKLKDAVERHGGKVWAAISSLVPSRTKKQCYNRWHSDALVASCQRPGK